MRTFSRLMSVLIASFLLAGCSLAPILKDDSVDYNFVIEDVSNMSLVTNVLRARDEVPLYFPDLSQVRGSITASVAAQATIPFGPRFGATTRSAFQGGPLTLSTNPTFDIAPTNTKQFYQGLLNPISEDLFDYYMERYRGGGMSAFLFYLMVDSVVVTTKGESPKAYPWREAEFVTYADRWFKDASGVRGPRIVPLAGRPRPLGPPVKADADSILKAVAAGFEVKSVGSDKIQISQKASGVAICFPDVAGYVSIDVIQNSDVKKPTGEKPATGEDHDKRAAACDALNKNKHAERDETYSIQLRSVEQIFFFLGALVRADNSRALRQDGPYRGCPLLPFYISNRPEKDMRFSVSYRDESYYVSNTSRQDACGRRDSTLPILGVVNDLLNLNRDANEVPTTKAVETVGK